MASLPYKRATEVSSLLSIGIDSFLPFYVKERRVERKRYGAIFVWLDVDLFT